MVPHWAKLSLSIMCSGLWLASYPGVVEAALPPPFRYHIVPKPIPRQKPSVPSIAQGAALFARSCLSCHGPRGDGEGFWTLPTGASVPRLDNLTTEDLPTQKIAQIIAKGDGMMPAWGDVMTPEQLQSLTLYVESLNQRTAPTRKTEPPKLKPQTVLLRMPH
jgi:mono/diheme cytochrome c family protein